MPSSNNLPELPRDSVPSDAGAWLLVIAIALIPLLWLPVFHTGFEAPRQALVLVVMAPVAALVLPRNWAQRGFARVPVACVLAIVAAGLVPHFLGTFDVHSAWRSLRFLAPLIALILAGAALMHPRFLPRLRMALVLPAIPVLAIGLLRRYADFPELLPDRADVAISSTLGNSNALGEAFAPVVLAGLCFAPSGATRARRALLWTGTACALALVLLSQSRGAQLALGAGLVAYGFLWFRDHRDRPEVRRRALVATAGAAAVALAALSLPFAAPARAHLASFVSTAAPTNAVRLAVWDGTLDLILDSAPLGAGLGRFEPAFLPHRRAAEWDLSGPDTRVDNPHQEFLWITSEAGVLGLAALLLLFGVATSRATRPPDGLTGLMAPQQRALLLATVSLVVLACVRAPFHHPSGILVFATLLGSVAPRVVRAPRFQLDVLLVPLLGAFAILALLDAREDVRLGRAISALNEGRGAARSDPARAVPLLQESGRRLKTTHAAILKDFDRSFRAALASGDLADLKEAAAGSAPPEASADFPDQEDVRALLEETLRLCPRHPGATNQLALLWLKQGFVAHAETTWKDAIAALPAAPRFRHNLASLYQRNERFGDALLLMQDEARLRSRDSDDDRALRASLALGLGRDEATFGRYLGPVDAPSSSPPDAAVAPLERRKALLLRLFEHPGDGDSLASLAEVDFKLGSRGPADEEILSEGNRAYARSRVRFAVASAESGDLAQAELFLKAAVNKDHALLDARFLRAKVGARGGKPDLVLESLRAMLDRGVRAEVLAGWVGKDPDLSSWRSDGRLASLGL
jgi:tetratricopeptide (TPR) repeat protein